MRVNQQATEESMSAYSDIEDGENCRENDVERMEVLFMNSPLKVGSCGACSWDWLLLLPIPRSCLDCTGILAHMFPKINLACMEY